MNDILDAVPIDKYFELFKPGAGGEGGYIRISINFVKDLKDLDKSTGASPQRVMSTCRAQRNGDAGKSHDGRRICAWFVVSLAPVPVHV